MFQHQWTRNIWQKWTKLDEHEKHVQSTKKKENNLANHSKKQNYATAWENIAYPSTKTTKDDFTDDDDDDGDDDDDDDDDVLIAAQLPENLPHGPKTDDKTKQRTSPWKKQVQNNTRTAVPNSGTQRAVVYHPVSRSNTIIPWYTPPAPPVTGTGSCELQLGLEFTAIH